MSTTESRGKGVLVIHDDEAVAWLSPMAPAVASVRIAVGRGAVVEVDAANPAFVLGWALQAGGDVESLGIALGEPQLADGLAKLAATGEEVFTKSAPILTQPWVRRATIAAVDQCTVRPLREGALLLDQAAADHKTGRTEVAATLFRMAAPSLLALGEECLSGYISGGAAADVADIADIAAQSLTGSGWEPDVVELAAQLKAESDLDDDFMRDVMDKFVAEWTPVLVGAGDLGGEGAPTMTGMDVVGFWIDPLVVPARLLAWPGADQADLLVTVDQSAGHATVTAKLAENADARSAEAGELIAYAADPDTGTIVAIAPMHVEGRQLTATIVTDSFAGLEFGVYQAETDPEELRIDRVGQLLVTVDRRMLDAYNHHRLAQVAIHRKSVTSDIDAMEAARLRHVELAMEATESASDAIAGFLSNNAALPDDVLTMLQRRKAAIDDYVAGLDENAVAPLGSSPLLTELLPVEGDEDDDGTE